MSSTTPNLGLFKYDIEQDANTPFSITTALNNNWDIIDEKCNGGLNNPYSLFDSKYSDHELNNLSWLKSEGQWNSKAVYPDAYDKLLKVYNGTETVEGLSVKLSTEAYTDYDFVLNTANTTFRLPFKTKLASGKAVVGNGMSLGLYIGTQYAGLAVNSQVSGQPRVLIGDISNYGKSVGRDTGAGFGNTSSIGITTDPTKSGIETTDEGLYLYYYVGETVQNANLIDAGRIGEVLAGKVDVSNAQWATNACMPDYSASITMTSPFTAPCDGFVYLLSSSGVQRWVKRSLIDNIDFWITCSTTTSAVEATTVLIPKGLTLTKDKSSTKDYSFFIPMKGIQ